MAGHRLDGAAFAQAISSADGLRYPIIVLGLVRKTTDANVIELSLDIGEPEHWLKIPASMIHEVELVGQTTFGDKTYDVVTIEFEWPTSPEAQVFASLLQDVGSADTVDAADFADSDRPSRGRTTRGPTKLPPALDPRKWPSTWPPSQPGFTITIPPLTPYSRSHPGPGGSREFGLRYKWPF